jgi:hypothetical protein
VQKRHIRQASDVPLISGRLRHLGRGSEVGFVKIGCCYVYGNVIERKTEVLMKS